MKKNDLSERIFTFAINVIRYLRDLPNTFEYKIIKYQLTKSATSVGANYEESQAGVSRAEFHNKVLIALKEVRESNYWLRIIKELFNKDETLENLIKESNELKMMLGTIANKTHKT